MMPGPRRIAWAAAMLLLTASCEDRLRKNDKNKGRDREVEIVRCESNQDCTGGLICLAGECTDFSQRAVVTGAANRVTADKIKRDVEQKVHKRLDKMDRAIEEGVNPRRH